jgi:glycosyltransferase involved in cell wall biosynthesis
VTSLSAIIPTRDRPELLADTLKGLHEQELPDGSMEVIVVDDGSSSDLAALVAALPGTARVPTRVVRQAPAGLNAARNRGAAEARGAILAYLDDDVLVAPNWARGVLDAIAASGADAVAGRILLNLAGEPPRWLSPRLRRYLSELDLGTAPRLLTDEEDAYGANCAIARPAFERIGGFGDELDREGASLRSNGDVEMFRRLRAHGGRIAYAPQAVVDHRVPPERLTAAWFRRRAFAQGHSDELLLSPPASAAERVRRLAREVIRTGRAAPILVRNMVLGRGVVGASIWICDCRGRAATLRDRRPISV